MSLIWQLVWFFRARHWLAIFFVGSCGHHPLSDCRDAQIRRGKFYAIDQPMMGVNDIQDQTAGSALTNAIPFA